MDVTMNSQEQKESGHITNSDINSYFNVDNEEKRISMKRKLTHKIMQMSLKLKHPTSLTCSLLHSNLLNENRMPKEFVNSFDDFLKKNNVNCEPVRNNRISAENTELYVKHLKQKYKSLSLNRDEVTNEDVKAMFEHGSKSTNKGLIQNVDAFGKTKAISGYNQFNTDSNADDDEIFSFNLPFNKNKKLSQSSNNESPTNRFVLNQRNESAIRSTIAAKENMQEQHHSLFSTKHTVLPDFHKKSTNYENQGHSVSMSSSVNQNPYKRKFTNEFDGDYHRRQPSYAEEVYQPVRKQNSGSQDDIRPNANSFKTGLEELEIRYEEKYGSTANAPAATTCAYKNPPCYYSAPPKKTLGGRRTVQSAYVPPFVHQEKKASAYGEPCSDTNNQNVDERLKHIDPKMIELIRNDIMDRLPPLSWDDIAGLEYAKSIIKEAVVWPMLRPDIFTGLRKPPRGILLFGPPGTGKTLIGKCIASQSKSTFFSISASSLTSKWIGEGEKMVRALFAVAAVHQPAVIFIDEIDSLLCQRSESEHESSRRLKTEFLVQLEGATTSENERILIVGATNRPQELDEAARRRFVRRLYIPLPELSARNQIINNLLKSEKCEITSVQIQEIGKLTEGFSGADMKVLCHEASMEPIRSIPSSYMDLVDINDVRPVNYVDFRTALQSVRTSVSQADLKHYIEWDRTYGSGSGK